MNADGAAGRILALLGLFTEARPEWTPDEMMAMTGHKRPTLYRYLRALREAGLVTSLAGRGYVLGPRVVELDFLLRRSDPLLQAGRFHLERLAANWPATALLVRWYGTRLLCVDSVSSAAEPRSSYPRGRPMPLARGAISRVILAHLPRRQMLQRIEANLAELAGLGLGETAEAVAERFRAVRREGHAIARGEVTPGVVGVAAPVFDGGPAPVAALCLTIAAERATDELLPRIAREVRIAAGTLSRALGGDRGEGRKSA